MMSSVSYSVKNIVGKGENVGLPVFSPFPTMFSKPRCFRVIKNLDCILRVISLPNDKS